MAQRDIVSAINTLNASMVRLKYELLLIGAVQDDTVSVSERNMVNIAL